MSDAHLRELRSETLPERKKKLGSTAPQKRQIFLEGWSDVKFFEENHKVSNVIFLPPSFGSNKNGKEFVKRSVRKRPSSFGIVDMDYDFKVLEDDYGNSEIRYSKGISEFDNIVDTSEYCCLLSWVMHHQEKSLIDVVIEFLQFLFKGDPGILFMVRAKVNLNSEDFTNFVNELTKARLFRGSKGISSMREELDIQFDQIGNQEEATKHLIPKKDRVDFENYKKINQDALEKAVPNDHDIVDALFFLIRTSKIPIDLKKIKTKFTKFQTSNIGSKEGRQGAAKSLVDKLNLQELEC